MKETSAIRLMSTLCILQGSVRITEALWILRKLYANDNIMFCYLLCIVIVQLKEGVPFEIN